MRGKVGQPTSKLKLVTYQASSTRERSNDKRSCPGLIPVLWSVMSVSSILLDTQTWLPLIVAVVPVTWLPVTWIGVLDLIPSVTKLPCREVNVFVPAADMQVVICDDCAAMSLQAPLRLPAATACIQFVRAAPGVLLPAAAADCPWLAGVLGLASALEEVEVVVAVEEVAAVPHALTHQAVASRTATGQIPVFGTTNPIAEDLVPCGPEIHGNRTPRVRRCAVV
jgi:hypothetical protein